jgi:hypothetical protein
MLDPCAPPDLGRFGRPDVATAPCGACSCDRPCLENQVATQDPLMPSLIGVRLPSMTRTPSESMRSKRANGAYLPELGAREPRLADEAVSFHDGGPLGEHSPVPRGPGGPGPTHPPPAPPPREPWRPAAEPCLTPPNTPPDVVLAICEAECNGSVGCAERNECCVSTCVWDTKLCAWSASCKSCASYDLTAPPAEVQPRFG